MGRATSAVLASLVAAKLVVDRDILAFAIDARIEKEWLLSSQGPRHEVATSCYQRLLKSLSHQTASPVLLTFTLMRE